MTKLLLETLKGNPGERVPFWYMRQAGRYLQEYRDVRATTNSFMEFCYTPEKAAEVTLQPLRRFGMDGAILFADILVVPDALGQKVWFESGVGPRLEPITTSGQVTALDIDAFDNRAGNVYKTLEILQNALPEGVTQLGFAGAPWTVATYMVEGAGSKDHGAAKDWGYRDPAGFDLLLEKLVDATSHYLIKQIDAGADAVQIFDSWSAALPEPAFDRWVIAPTKEIIRRIRKVHSETPIIGFPRLAGCQLEKFVDQTGINGVSLDSGVPLDWAKTAIQSKVCTQGNLDPRMVVAGGEMMRAEATRILETFRDGPHVFNLGHGFVPETPVAHVAELSQLVKDFRR